MNVDAHLPGKRRGIATKLLLAFGTVTVAGILAVEGVRLVGLPFFGIDGSLQEFRARALQTLNDTADVRRDRLQAWLTERRQDAQALAENASVNKAVCSLADQLGQGGARNEIGPAFWERYRRLPALTTLHRDLQALRDSAPDTYRAVGFYDVDSGLVIASSRMEAIGAPSLLGQAFFARATTPGQFEGVDVLRSPVDGEEYLTFTQQVFELDGEGNKSRLRAVAVLLVHMDGIPVIQTLHGGKKTEEVILVNHDRRIMTPLRFPLPDGSSATINRYHLDTPIAAQAAAGGEGFTRARDYRGAAVLAAFRHVLISPELGWGLIVKQDEAEALAPLYAELRQRAVLVLALLALLLLVVMLVARRLAAPVARLAAVAKSIEGGNLTARSGLAGQDEIGVLARSFDGMAERIQAWHETLSREVQARTRQLERANQLYRVLSETNQMIVRSHHRGRLFSEACRIAVQYGHFKAAWLMASVDESGAPFGQMRHVAYWSDTPLHCWDGQCTDASTGECFGCDLNGVCATQEDRLVVNDIHADPRAAPCRQALERAGWLALASFPLRSEDTVYGTFAVASSEKHTFAPSELALLSEMAGDIAFAIRNNRREARRAEAEAALRLVAEQLSMASGSGFFQAAARGLASLLKADYVLVGELDEADRAIATVGLVTPAGDAENIRYALAGTPCANVLDMGVCVYASDAATMFPEDRLLAEMGVQAYAGVTLVDTQGRAIGLIAVLWRHPLEGGMEPEPVLRIFAARTAAELLRSRSEAELRASEQARRVLAYAVEQGPAGVVITNPSGEIEYVNSRFLEGTGYALEECLGRNPRFLKSGMTPQETYRTLWRTISGGGTWRGEICNRRKDGELFWVSVSIGPLRDDAGNIRHFVELAEDITLRKQYEAKLVRQAHYDDLTSLPNRLLAMDRMLGSIARAERTGGRTGVMFIDLDNFKQVNDSLGHSVGDGLLKLAASRLEGCVREVDTVSRMGGDEFLILLPDLRDSIDAEKVARKILSAFGEHFLVDRHEVYATVSIGITICPDDGDEPGTLMRNADAAMYRAKTEGRDTYRFFSAEIARQSERRLRVETLLRRAIERNELYPVYQPIIDVGSGRPVGAELLLRWNNADLNPVYPDEFIAVAEDTGLIVPIGEFVLGQACNEAKAWQADAGVPLRVAVNVSARQFRSNDFAALVERTLSDSGLPAGLLEIEITERAVVEDTGKAVQVLDRLRTLGVRVSMDDFGTGYSSLSYLHDLPLDTLKIDKSFTRDLLRDSQDANLTEAIIAIGRTLGLEVLAEGVEEKAQLEFLASKGCHLAQGYYFGRPVPAAEFRAWLQGTHPAQ